MRFRLRTRTRHRTPRQRGSGNRRVVDDAIADHLDEIGVDGNGISRNLGDLPRQLIGARKMLRGFVGTNGMLLHDTMSSAV